MQDRLYYFAIDETISVDEDYFELSISPVLNMLMSETDDDFCMIYIKKQSQFQKRVFWQLENICLRYLYFVDISTINEYTAENFEDKNISIVSYIENEKSEAAKFVSKEKSKGTKIIDLRKRIYEYERDVEKASMRLREKMKTYYDELHT